MDTKTNTKDAVVTAEKQTVAPAKPTTVIGSGMMSGAGHILTKSEQILVDFGNGKIAEIITVVNSMLEDALMKRTSDIHIDPARDYFTIRYRIDGLLQEAYKISKAAYSEVISRIKIMSGLRIDEHQAAQDGGFRNEVNGQPIDVRVSIAPTYYGENAVLRLLINDQEKYTLDNLGLSPHNQEQLLKAIKHPYGMILATGPTGSGKSTTLYTVLKLLNTPEVSIVTIEDPVEYTIEGIEQIQINPHTNLTFANGLRSILRQDPNIIMVGEIRDQETAGIAVNTSLTGHLLLSTLHTNDAATSIPRLLDLKVEPYLIASTMNIAMGQRLVRKICESCKVERKITAGECTSLQKAMPEAALQPGQTFYIGKGCDVCGGSGYKQRVGIHEVLVMDDLLREAVVTNRPASEIKKIAVKQGMIPMLYDGLEKAKQGITTIDEILRVLYE